MEYFALKVIINLIKVSISEEELRRQNWHLALANNSWLGKLLAPVKLSEKFIKSVSKDVMNGDVMYPTSLGVKLLAGNVLETHYMVDMGRRLWSLIFCIQVMVPVDVPKLRVVADLRTCCFGTNSFTSWQFFLIRVNCNCIPRLNAGSSSRSPSTSSWLAPLLITVAGVTPFCKSTYFF
ncbi:hypothetical protein MKW98_005445 [Papaver atlanticum]|uniref:Uncharacterized protein n=1 Tax=Papaver atlanticum TaxID=357466 RepID=A0AAD4T8R1_9MAGN|nr:hypothetical protein MKW98_005445 [Papaver atlanticum]